MTQRPGRKSPNTCTSSPRASCRTWRHGRLATSVQCPPRGFRGRARGRSRAAPHRRPRTPQVILWAPPRRAVPYRASADLRRDSQTERERAATSGAANPPQTSRSDHAVGTSQTAGGERTTPQQDAHDLLSPQVPQTYRAIGHLLGGGGCEPATADQEFAPAVWAARPTCAPPPPASPTRTSAAVPPRGSTIPSGRLSGWLTDSCPRVT